MPRVRVSHVRVLEKCKKEKWTVLCAAVGTASHQRGLETCAAYGICCIMTKMTTLSEYVGTKLDGKKFFKAFV